MTFAGDSGASDGDFLVGSGDVDVVVAMSLFTTSCGPGLCKNKIVHSGTCKLHVLVSPDVILLFYLKPFCLKLTRELSLQAEAVLLRVLLHTALRCVVAATELRQTLVRTAVTIWGVGLPWKRPVQHMTTSWGLLS